MKTKEEIEASMYDRIPLGQSFFGEDESDEDKQVYLNMMADIRGIINEEESITSITKRLFEEVLEMEFNETQWFALTLIISVFTELSERRGARKLADVMALLEGNK